ncbi:MAG: ribosome maturation factor RimP [Acidimicrobiales bacterium]
MVPAQSIGELVQPLVTAAGLELWDVEVSPGNVRVLVDRPGGVDLDALADLHRRMASVLDDCDLQVSSPGVERVLRTPAHYRQYLGATLSVKAAEPIDGSRRFEGVLQEVGDGGITLDISGRTQSLAYDQIQKAHSVFVWGPRPRPVAKGGAR